MGASRSSLVSAATAPLEVSLTGPERGPAAAGGGRGNAARVEECGLSRRETPTDFKVDQAKEGLVRLGAVHRHPKSGVLYTEPRWLDRPIPWRPGSPLDSRHPPEAAAHYVDDAAFAALLKARGGAGASP